MATIHNTEIDGLDRLMKKLDKIGLNSMETMKEAGKAAMMVRVRNPTVLKCPVNDGLLRASYSAVDNPDTGLRVRDVRPDESDVVFGSNLKYARYVEFGSGPHLKPTGSDDFVESITRWAEKKGIDDPWPLIWHIRAHGTKPHPHLRPGWDQGKDKLAPDIRRYMQQRIRSWCT